MGDGLLVALEGVGGRDQAPESGRRHQLDGQVEGARRGSAAPGGGLGARRRRRRPGSARGATAGPGRRRPCRACPPGPPCPGAGPWPGPRSSGGGAARRSRRPRRPRRSADRPAPASPAWRRTARASWSGGDRRGRRRARRPGRAGGRAWPRRRRCSGAAGRTSVVQGGGHGGQAERAGPDHGDHVAVGRPRPTARRGRRRRSARPSRRPRRSSARARRGAGWRGPPGGAVDQPPPVSAQKPVCRPGSRCPKARLPQWPVRPCGAAGAERVDVPRGAAEDRLDHGPVPGARVRPAWSVPPSSRTPTTSWPGTKGKLTRSSK